MKLKIDILSNNKDISLSGDKLSLGEIIACSGHELGLHIVFHRLENPSAGLLSIDVEVLDKNYIYDNINGVIEAFEIDPTPSDLSPDEQVQVADVIIKYLSNEEVQYSLVSICQS